MAHWQSNKRNVEVDIRYFRRWLRKGNNSKSNTKTMKYISKFRNLGMGVTLYWIKKNSDLQNPPSGPPLHSL